ncbi:hypothetical protein V8C86DRAFT_1126135 [Haematococcus lacustris]
MLMAGLPFPCHRTPTSLHTMAGRVQPHGCTSLPRALHHSPTGPPLQLVAEPLLRQVLARQLLTQLATQPSRMHDAYMLPGAPPPPLAWRQLEEDVTRHVREGGGGASQVLASHLCEQQHAVPPTPGPLGRRCVLCSRPRAPRFKQAAINAFLAAVFRAVEAAGEQPTPTTSALPRVRVSRYDLFHGHLFLGPHPLPAAKQGRQLGQPGQGLGLGLLLHSQEYPAWHPDHFPHHLGWCQHGSDVQYQPGLFRMRNILWWAGSLAVLDTGDGALWQDLRYPGALNTVDEGDCGRPLADVNFLPWSTAAGSHTALIPEPSCDEACAYGEGNYGEPDADAIFVTLTGTGA